MGDINVDLSNARSYEKGFKNDWLDVITNFDLQQYVVGAVNHCFTSLFGTKGLLSDIVIR